MKNEILSLLPPSFSWGESVYYLESVDSTSTYAKALAKDGAPEGTAVIAKIQTGGRGRTGRSFHSPEGGLYMTVILRPQCPAQAPMHLTCAAGIAAGDAIYAASGIRPGLKWINDLIIGTRKVGGILAEMSLTPSGEVEYALIGIGINCKDTIPPELSQIATSLDREAKKAVSPALLAAELLQALHRISGRLLSEQTAIMQQYRLQCVTTGHEVLLLRGEEKQKAFAISVEDDGGLLVEFPDRHREIISSGEVSVRGLFGYLS